MKLHHIALPALKWLIFYRYESRYQVLMDSLFFPIYLLIISIRVTHHRVVEYLCVCSEEAFNPFTVGHTPVCG